MKKRVLHLLPVALIIAALLIPLAPAQPAYATPDSGYFYPSVNSDDGGYREDPEQFARYNSTINIGKTSSTQNSWQRFDNVSIPRDSTIIQANFEPAAYSYLIGQTCRVLITAHAHDNSPATSNLTDLLARDRTTNSVNWTVPSFMTANNYYSSPDIKDMIDEVISRPGWTSGNSLLIFVDDNGSDTSAYRDYSSRDNPNEYYPRLYVEWTPPLPPPGLTASTSNVEESTATLDGNVSSINDTSIIERGFVWDTSSHGNPGNISANVSDYTNYWTEEGSWGLGAFNHGITGLTQGELYYVRSAAENNDTTWGYSSEISFLTKPEAPTLLVAYSAVDSEYFYPGVNSDDGNYREESPEQFAQFITPLYIGNTNNTTRNTWNRFVNVSVPQGSTIIKANFEPSADTYRIEDVVQVFLTGHAHDDSPATSNLTDLLARERTTSSTNWTVGHWTQGNEFYPSPEIKYIINEITDRAGWTSGNSILIFVDDDGSDVWAYRDYIAIDHGVEPPPRLYIEWESATANSSTQIDLTWTKGTGADKTKIMRKIGDYPTSKTDGVEAYFGTDATYADTGLVPGTHYYYRVWSYATEGGKEQYSDAYDQTNANTASGFAVTTLPASGIDTTSAVLEGTLTDDGEESCSLRFVYGLDANYGNSTPWESGYTTGASYSKVITGLSASTQYHFRIEAKHADETTVYGIDRVFTTTSLGAPSVTTTSATEVTDSSAKLQGTLDSLGNYSPVYVYFEYGQTTGYGITSAEQTRTATGGFNQSIAGLSSGTTYHFRAVVRYDSNYVYGGDQSFIAAEAGEPGIDPPDILRIDDIKVFTNYLNSGDQLYVIAYRIVYSSGTPTLDCSDYFDFQLLDGTTLKAQTPVKSWNYKPGSIYMIADSAPTWGGSYRVKIIGNPNKWETPPEAYRDLTSGDWQGDDLVQLDTWVISLAESLQSYYNTEMVVYTMGGTPVLSPQGGVIFNMGIPGLSAVRPHLFKARVEYAEYDKPVREDKLQPQLDPRQRLGPYISGIIEEGGALVGQDLNATVGWIFGILYIFIAVVVGIFTGMWIVGFAVIAPVVLAGMWVGGIPVAGLMLVASIVVLFILKATWLRGI